MLKNKRRAVVKLMGLVSDDKTMHFDLSAALNCDILLRSLHAVFPEFYAAWLL